MGMKERSFTMKRKRTTTHSWLVRTLPLLLILGACATGSIRERVLTMPTIKGASYVGPAVCVGCHEGVAETMKQNVHGRLADWELMGAQQGCESCHGRGSLHAESGDTALILNPAKLRSDESAALCAACHTSGQLMGWTHSEHALADVGCADCHRIHAEGKPLKASLKQADPQLCFGCHQEQQAQTNFPSHHPIKEGKMTCSSCHNVHAGSGLKTAEQTNDLCFNCHTRHQGPFVFEHAPAQEDCSICHSPHGTVANNLLKQNEPFLCLQCHESHFHTLRIGATLPTGNVAWSAYDSTLKDGSVNNLSAANNPLSSAASNLTVPIQNSHGEVGWQKAFGTKCTVCHSMVHGSDLPSQTAPTVNTTNTRGWPAGGKGLTR
jgi:DmsE family decaheme c-type cytochrome